uniref:Bacteriocin lactocin-705 n=3 Tax=Lactobacillaceae TaxID=33958 RepID=LC70_LACPA|nr:RecName: Full=Bacteriocin lactocin-705 [Lacticaseibacillus paracasei]
GMSGYIQGIPDFLKGYLHGISAANKHKKGRL